MSDLITGFQSGEQQKKSWFQEAKDNALQRVAEKPLKFMFWTMTLGIVALKVFLPVIQELEVLGIKEMENLHVFGMRPGGISGFDGHSPFEYIYGGHSVMRGPDVAGFDGHSFFDGEYGGHSVMRGNDVAGFNGHSMFENR